MTHWDSVGHNGGAKFKIGMHKKIVKIFLSTTARQYLYGSILR
jgi:hypothetical protein